MLRLTNQFTVTNLVKIGPSKFYAIKRGIQQITRILYPVPKKVCQNLLCQIIHMGVQLSPVF